MKLKDLLISIFWSVDMISAIVVVGLLSALLPPHLEVSFSQSFYNIGITVLSIVFSLFFASLAIIMASPDNDFIAFMEEEKHYSALMDTFKITLIVLFGSLVYSIILYVYCDFLLKHCRVCDPSVKMHTAWFIAFAGFFIYSLIAVGLSVMDTIFFSMKRIHFLQTLKTEEDEKAPD